MCDARFKKLVGKQETTVEGDRRLDSFSKHSTKTRLCPGQGRYTDMFVESMKSEQSSTSLSEKKEYKLYMHRKSVLL